MLQRQPHYICFYTINTLLPKCAVRKLNPTLLLGRQKCKPSTPTTRTLIYVSITYILFPLADTIPIVFVMVRVLKGEYLYTITTNQTRHMTHNKLYRKLWRDNGSDYQLNILIEEMSELTKAILKARRYNKSYTNKMIEELTDVKICAEQLEQYINEPNKMEKMRVFKLKRLKKLINKHN